ncbi:MAG: hypothetical protein CMQ41_16570 [Gammaproteobacteria bacterium]|nr:hypothetical protein [Gammaproteobacteria bacterium]MBM89978.1 hypothetical protein [Gammaproteobacteria bacterium]|tara:strand:- start:567 stop:896 length:330 start_codon:yes stop_codon:yes gene_type:complete
MSSGITKTIPVTRGEEGLDSLYNGIMKEFEFHMAGNPSKLKVGDFVYTIFKDELRGRLEITHIIPGAKNPKSGRPRTLIMVKCPGEKIKEIITQKGHRGTRYYDGAGWN